MRQLREVPLAPRLLEALEEKRLPKESGSSQDVAQGPQENTQACSMKSESATVESTAPARLAFRKKPRTHGG